MKQNTQMKFLTCGFGIVVAFLGWMYIPLSMTKAISVSLEMYPIGYYMYIIGLIIIGIAIGSEQSD